MYSDPKALTLVSGSSARGNTSAVSSITITNPTNEIGITTTASNNGIQLTVREKEVMSWFAKGKSLDEVGQILGISYETVRSHQKAIYKKLGVNQRTLAVVTAVRNGLIDP